MSYQFYQIKLDLDHWNGTPFTSSTKPTINDVKDLVRGCWRHSMSHIKCISVYEGFADTGKRIEKIDKPADIEKFFRQ